MNPGIKIIEVRYFAFSTAAVVDALLAADRENGGTLYTLPLIGSSIDQTNGFNVTLSFYDVTTTKTCQFAPPQVAAALILYCRLRKIPLPRAGKKSLEWKGENLCLKIVLNGEHRPLVASVVDAALNSAA